MAEGQISRPRHTVFQLCKFLSEKSAISSVESWRCKVDDIFFLFHKEYPSTTLIITELNCQKSLNSGQITIR